MFRLVFLAFLAVLAVGVQPASAQPRRARDVQPLDQVLPQVRRQHPGTFYDADGPFNDESGNPHYRLKWMTPEGRVIWLDTDARTGRVLGVDRTKSPRNYAPPPDMRAPPPGYFEGPRPDIEDRYRGGGRNYRENREWNNGRGRQNGRDWQESGGRGGRDGGRGDRGRGNGHGHGR